MKNRIDTWLDNTLLEYLDADFRVIGLTQGRVAKVPAEFFEELNRHKWCAVKGRYTYYAVRRKPDVAGKPQGLLHLHREVLRLAGQDLGDLHVDHIDGNGLDNRLGNLRLVTNRANCQNCHTHRSGRLPGAYWDKRKQQWRAHVTMPGASGSQHIGHYKSEQEAHEAYLRAVALIQTGWIGPSAELRTIVQAPWSSPDIHN